MSWKFNAIICVSMLKISVGLLELSARYLNAELFA